MTLITLEQVRDDWKACYRPRRLAALFRSPKTPLEVLAIKRGTWADVPSEDRLWVVLREGVLPDKTLRLFGCWCADTSLAMTPNPDPRSIAAVEVARRFALGEATRDELDAARYAAWVAARDAAWDASWGVAWVAARVAEGDATEAAYWAATEAAAGFASAAKGAAWGVAWAASRDAQVAQLISMIRLDNSNRTP